MTDEQRAREAARWLVYSREHNAFWRANRAGYTNLIEHAGRYTKAEADACCRSRDHAHPDNPPEVAVLAPEAAQALAAKEERIAELEGALKPFAEAAQDCLEDDEPDRCDAWEHGCAMAVNLGDFRRAASTFFPAALTPAPKEQEVDD